MHSTISLMHVSTYKVQIVNSISYVVFLLQYVSMSRFPRKQPICIEYQDKQRIRLKISESLLQHGVEQSACFANIIWDGTFSELNKELRGRYLENLTEFLFKCIPLP